MATLISFLVNLWFTHRFNLPQVHLKCSLVESVGVCGVRERHILPQTWAVTAIISLSLTSKPSLWHTEAGKCSLDDTIKQIQGFAACGREMIPWLELSIL